MQQQGRFPQGGAAVLGAFQGDQPHLLVVPGQHRARGPLAEEGGAEVFSGSVQHDLPPQQQQGAAADHMGGQAELVAGSALQLQPLTGCPGQDRATAGHQQQVIAPQGHPGLQLRYAEKLTHAACLQQQARFRATQGPVAGPPIRVVAADAPLHIATVDIANWQPLAARPHDPLGQLQPAKAGQGPIAPCRHTPVQDRPGEPAAVRLQGPQGEATHPVEVAAIDGDPGLLLVGELHQ